MRTPPLLLKIAIFVVVLATLISTRWIFSYSYDTTYMNDYYDHSQWQIPLSNRVMSDADLYQVAGQRYLAGTDFFTINPEVPPLGKLLYGFAIQEWSNPYFVVVLFYILNLGLLYWLSRLVIQKEVHRWLALLLIASMPLFSSSLTETTLDAIQVSFLLGHVIAVGFIPQRKWLASILAGVSLGLFSAVKIAFFTPLILLVTAGYLWQKKLWKHIFVVGVFTAIGYGMVYLPYLQNHSIFELISNQKWMIQFYLDGSVEHIFGVAAMMLATGLYKGWWGESWQFSSVWSAWWPVMLVLAGLLVWQKKNTWSWKSISFQHYLFGVIAIIFLAMMILPFWPRYLLLVMPIGILIFISALVESKLQKFVWLIVVIAGLQFFFTIFPTPQTHLGLVERQWRDGTYQEFYGNVDTSSISFDRMSFSSKLQNELETLQLTERNLELTHGFVWPWQSSVLVVVTTTYTSQLGEYSHQSETYATKSKGRWYLQWNWNILAPDFTEDATFAFEQVDPNPSTLYASNGVPILKIDNYPVVSLKREYFSDDEPTRKRLAELLDTSTVGLLNYLFVDHRYVEQPVWGKLPFGYDSAELTFFIDDGVLIVEDQLKWSSAGKVTSPDELNHAMKLLPEIADAEVLGTIYIDTNGQKIKYMEQLPQQPYEIYLSEKDTLLLPSTQLAE